MSPTNAAADVARRALLKMSDSTVLSAVDGLDLREHAKISAVVGIPLRNLQQRRDVGSFVTSAPIAAVTALLELLAMSTLEKVIVALGERADAPSLDELTAAVDKVRSEGASLDEVVAVLAFAVVEEFPAAPHCRQLLESRPELALPELPLVVDTAPSFSPRQTDPAIKELRRRRREEEKSRRKGPSSQRPIHPSKVKPRRAAPAASDVRAAVVEDPQSRRPLMLTPLELERFDPDHSLTGSVVIVEVPFDATDPVAPDLRSKERPVLVVAASDNALLVRPIYSNRASTRNVFQAWRRLGLDHVSYVDDTRIAVNVESTATLERIGRLSDAEWNAQL